MPTVCRHPLGRVVECLESRDVPSAAFQSLPTIPELSNDVLANLRSIAQLGKANGLRQDVFLKAGDSNTASPEFLFNLGNPSRTTGALPADLTATLQTYRAPINAGGENSFTRNSVAAISGTSSRDVLKTISTEIATTRGGIALLMVGTNDTAIVSMAEFQQNLTAIVDQLLSVGVIPVLSTIPKLLYRAPSSVDAAAMRNQFIADLAESRQIPLLNLWNALETIPLAGLKSDLVHLNVSPNGSGALSPVDLLYGQNLRSYLTLQTLSLLKQQVFNFDPQLEAAKLQSFWTSLQPGTRYIVTGSAAGEPSLITVTDATTGERVGQIKPFEASFLGGVRVAAGDLNGDGITDIVAAAGRGGGPAVKIYSGQTGEVIQSFFAYEPSFLGGVNIAIGDSNRDGWNDLAIGSGPGGGPRVKIYSGPAQTLTQDFLALDPNFRGGINVAIGSFGLATSAGDSGGPIVQLFDPGAETARTAYFAYDSSFRGGVTLTTADVDNDGLVELITAPGPGGGPLIRLWNPGTAEETGSILASNNGGKGGYRVAGLPGQLLVGGGSSLSLQRYTLEGQRLDAAAPPDAGSLAVG